MFTGVIGPPHQLGTEGLPACAQRHVPDPPIGN